MRILVVSDFYPWPEDSGGRLRLGAVVRALAGLGTVEVFALSTRSAGAAPPSEVTRFAVGARRVTGPRGAARIGWLVAGGLPSELHRRDYRGARSTFSAWSAGGFDLAWFRGAESHLAVGDLVDAPSVVDFDDLEDQKLSAWLTGPAADTGVRRGAVRMGWSRLRARTDRRRWGELQRRIAGKVHAVTVCSGLDRQRLAVPNVWVVPNGYPVPAWPVGRAEVGDPPTVVFPGQFSYPPNLDGARYLVADVLPRLRSRIPDVAVRLVGRHDQRLELLASEPGVRLTGRVPDMAPELARADLVAVPVRFGSGTRIKILEAFAHRIPVVSTSLGCEGLDVEEGRHLLVADRPADFAEACYALLHDVRLRTALTQAAHELYRERYRWEVITPRVVELATKVATGVAPADVAAGP